MPQPGADAHLGPVRRHIGGRWIPRIRPPTTAKVTGVQIATRRASDRQRPGAGQWGIVLSTRPTPDYDAGDAEVPWTRRRYLKMHNFRVGTVEDAVCWKLRKHSWELAAAFQDRGQEARPE